MNSKQKEPTKYIYNNYYKGIGYSEKLAIKKKKRRNYKRITILILIILIAAGIFYYWNSHKKHVVIYHKAAIVTPKPESENTAKVTDEQKAALDSMENSVNTIIQQNPNIDFEVAITDINNGDQYNFGQTQPMTAASVSKIITATDFLNQVEDGDETLNETLEDGNTASADLESMIVVSNDNAWAALNNDLSSSQLQNYAQSIGVTSFNYANNTLTARDTADVLCSLYQGSLLNSSNTQLLLGYLKEANYRQYILPAIPTTDTVYHKIGLYNDNVNDATIITNGTQTISLVIFTNGNGIYNWPARAVLMQDITKPILQYFNLN